MSPRNLRKMCAKNNIGVLINGRLRILAPADLPKIEGLRRPRGNPNFRLKKKSGRKS